MRLAARPVGAHKRRQTFFAARMRRMEFTRVVLPAPGPPVITITFERSAASIAVFWLVASARPVRASTHGMAFSASIDFQGSGPRERMRSRSAIERSARYSAPLLAGEGMRVSAGDVEEPDPVCDPARYAVIYARVSSKEQEKEGFSIPAQLKLLKDYAAANGLTVAQEYVDVETAKQTGRTSFDEMVAYLKAHPSIRVMLVEKTDRLYRNLKDWVTRDDLDVEMHFPKEGVVLSRESRSSEKFMHGIKVLMAKNYIDNLSEEARKGMQEKAEQGIWPTKTPLGYRNIIGPDGKKIIAVDTAVAPIVTKLFDWYASGSISLKEATKKAQAAGLVYAENGAKVPVSTVHTILRNRLYTGQFEWNGKIIQGKHEPLVSIDLWERIQGMMDGRHAKKAKRGKHDFAFSGLIACHSCGCAVVGEIKKERYVYYHCTGYADKC
jgi:site-specific DNA recombinase